MDTPEERKAIVLGMLEDVVADFLYYDRKESTEWPMRGDIQASVAAGEVSADEMVEAFRKALADGLAWRT